MNETPRRAYRYRRPRHKGPSQAPARSARPCAAGASRCRPVGERRKRIERPERAALRQSGDNPMKDPQREVEELRAGVNCATVLEKATPPWLLDRKESSKRCLKYRRGAGEIVIVTHGGAGWWDPNSDAKGDVFRLVQHLEPSLNFGEVRKVLAAARRGSTRFHAGRARPRQTGSSHPDRPKMGAPAAPAALLRRLALPRGQGTDRGGPDRCGAFRRHPRRPARLRLVPASRCAQALSSTSTSAARPTRAP